MTPNRPIELVNASKACAEAWLKRDAMIESGDKIGVLAMDIACDLLQERYNDLYQKWQILGGTSNIESIAFPFVDYEHAHWLEVQATRESDRPQ